MSHRVVLGLALSLTGVVIGTAIDVLEWTWPLNILAMCALTFPGVALFMPALERRVAGWLGRPYPSPPET